MCHRAGVVTEEGPKVLPLKSSRENQAEQPATPKYTDLGITVTCRTHGSNKARIKMP